MDKRLDDLLRRAGTPCTGHASEVLVRSSHTVTYQQNTWSDYMHYFYKGGELKLTATCAYTYVLGNVQAMSNHVKRMRAYLQILGFNNPLRTIWELTPFSFVIDWFIPIGDFLEQFSFDYFDSTVSVEEYCISWKTTVPHVVRVEFERSTTSARSKVCTFWYDIYHRQRAIPNDDKFGLRFDSRFGTKQVLLSGALLTSIFGH